MKQLAAAIATAFALWFVMFSPWTAPHVPFWWTMTGAALILTTPSTVWNRGWWRRLRFSWSEVLLGVAIAAALWGVYWVGDKLSQLMFSFARPQVNLIYSMKDGWSSVLLSVLLLLLIGPAEEIFWRGYVQQRLSERWNANAGFVVTTLVYAVVHAPSLNFMLLMAALVAGGVWGLAYRLMPRRFTAIILSHALWDAAVFIWFPIQ